MSAEQARAVADAFLGEHGARVGLSAPLTQLRHVDTRSDDLGLTKVVYHQEHLGLPVRNASVRVHVNPAGEVYVAYTKVVQDLPGDATPIVLGAQAIEVAEFAARDVYPFPDVAAVTEVPTLALVPLGLSRNLREDDTHLAWEVHVQFPTCPDGECPTFGAYVSVDARSGDVLYAVSDFQGLDRRVYDCSKQPNDTGCYLDSEGIGGYFHGRSEAAPLRGPHNNPAVPQYMSTDVDDTHDFAWRIHDFVWRSFGIDGANDRGGTRTTNGQEYQSRYYSHAEGWDGQQVSYCPGGAVFTSYGSILVSTEFSV